MSYQALYRKYRPSTLEDVIGQDIIIKIFKNSIINDKIGHAYLFSGPRGIGKTSIAKLVAKSVNCLSPIDGSPCEKCENCVSINNGFNADIIEIDAASNNGVDEIREIKNKINLVPNQLKYKVYIIDEVHMLSIGAFNALLKTLEEPPEYIIFILATTDPQKVPSTIISRCQCFEFHRISNENIINRLKYICKKEKISIDEEIYERIAELADGGLRDSIGMLDKLNAYSNSKITIDDFEKVNGIVSTVEKEKFLDLIINGNIVEIIKFIDNIYDKGKDLNIFLQDLIKILKNLIIDYYVNNNSKYDIDILLDLSLTLNNMVNDIKNTADIKTLFEINIISFINKQVLNLKKCDEKPQIEIKEEKNISQEIISTENVENYDEEYCSTVINNSFATADKKSKELFEKKWKDITNYAFDNKYGAVASFLSDGTIRVVGKNEFIISFEYESMINRGNNIIPNIKELLKKIYSTEYDIAIITNEMWNKIKQEFIENKNKGITYTYKKINKTSSENKNKKTNDDNITSQAIDLFGEDIISIN